MKLEPMLSDRWECKQPLPGVREIVVVGDMRKRGKQWSIFGDEASSDRRCALVLALALNVLACKRETTPSVHIV